MDPYPPSSCHAYVREPGASTPWRLIKSAWQSENRFPVYLFFSIVLGMTVSFVGLDMVFTYLYYHFYDVLQAYDKHGMLRLLGVFLIVMFCYGIVAAYRFYISRPGSIKWRRLLAERYIDRIFSKRKGEVEPLIHFSIDFSLGLISVISTFIIFIYMLWLLSEDLNIPLGAWGSLELSRCLISLGFIYAIVGTLRAIKRGRAFSFNFLFQKRFVSWFQIGFYQVSLIVPLLVVLPGYVDKIFLLSWLIQSMQTFTQVQTSFAAKMNGADGEMLLK